MKWIVGFALALILATLALKARAMLTNIAPMAVLSPVVATATTTQ